MRLVVAAFCLLLLLSGCSSPSPSGSDSTVDGSASSTSTTGAGPAANSSTTTPASSSSTTSQHNATANGSSSSSTTGSASSSSSSSAPAGNGTGNQTTDSPPAKPEPVTVKCSNTSLNFGTGPVTCSTDVVTSSNGARFTGLDVTVTWSGAGTNVAVTVKDDGGATLGTGSGLTSPIHFTVAADKMPAATSFALSMSASGVLAGFSPTATFTAS